MQKLSFVFTEKTFFFFNQFNEELFWDHMKNLKPIKNFYDKLLRIRLFEKVSPFNQINIFYRIGAESALGSLAEKNAHRAKSLLPANSYL